MGLDAFAALVENDVRSLMEDGRKETAALTPYQRDQQGYAGQRVRQFSARENFISDCAQILDCGVNLFALRGKSGAGKSTLMASWPRNCKSRAGRCCPSSAAAPRCATTALT